MSDNVESTAKGLLDNLDNPAIDKEVEIIDNRSQSELLKNSTFSFLRAQMKDVERYKAVINNALDSLNERILKNELDAKDTLTVINSLSTQVTAKTQVLLEPFKAIPNSSSPLLPPPKPDEESDLSKGINSLSGEEFKLMEKFFRAVQHSSKEE